MTPRGGILSCRRVEEEKEVEEEGGGGGVTGKRIFGRECTVLMLQVAAHSGGLALQWRCLHPL